MSGPRDERRPSATFSATVSVFTSMKCWWIIPIPCAIASAGEVIVTGRAVQPDLALVGLVEAVEHAHQRALAGAVLAEQRVHLARPDVEVDAVVGDHARETAS